ncbi:MAG: hypothetical protein JXD23_09935 [Spirochaetales bacterium]|nr:hypothetical protein [Spirochaetales bacterium]
MEGKPGHASLFLWEAAGAVFVIAAGSVLHFVYAWSGYSWWAGLFAPVNESVWEHLKLGFWPLILISAVEFPFVRRRAHNFFLAKFLSVAALELFIVLVFYAYTAFTGRPILAVDICSFVLGTVLCQLLSLLMYAKTRPASAARVAGVAGLALLAFCFMLFTYATPRLGIFRDRPTGGYGPVKAEIVK